MTCTTPEVFTPVGDAYTGETACDDCANACVPCGESLDQFEQEDGTVDADNGGSSCTSAVSTGDPITFPIIDENHWSADISGALPASIEFLCDDGEWVANFTVDGVVYTTAGGAHGTLTIPGSIGTATAVFNGLVLPDCEDPSDWQFDISLTDCGGV